LIGWCKFEGIYFVFSCPPTKTNKTPTHNAAHLQTLQAITQPKFAKELLFTDAPTNVYNFLKQL